MTRSNAKNALVRLFLDAFEQQQPHRGPHIAENDDLLVRWSLGTLDSEERKEIFQHLSDCPECRDAVALMIEEQALDFGEVADDARQEEPAAPATAGLRPSRIGRHSTLRSKVPWAAAIAVGILILVGLFCWPRERTRLAHSLALVEFKYHWDGRSYAKGGPATDQEIREREPLEEALRESPRDVRLMLQYGHLLLEQGNDREAAKQFEDALNIEPGNVDALTGLGVAMYMQKDIGIEAALAQFRDAAGRDPDHFAAQLNTAICLESLGRRNEALPYWRRAYELAPEHHKERLRKYLEERAITVQAGGKKVKV